MRKHRAAPFIRPHVQPDACSSPKGYINTRSATFHTLFFSFVSSNPKMRYLEIASFNSHNISVTFQ